MAAYHAERRGAGKGIKSLNNRAKRIVPVRQIARALVEQAIPDLNVLRFRGMNAAPKGEFPIAPPVEPMLAKLADELPPQGEYLYEPKWDGFRAIVFRGP